MEKDNLTSVLQNVVFIKNEIEKYRNRGILKDNELVGITDSIANIKTHMEGLKNELIESQEKITLYENQKEGLAEKSSLLEKKLEEKTAQYNGVVIYKQKHEKVTEENEQLKGKIKSLEQKLEFADNVVTGNESNDSELKLMIKEVSLKLEGMAKGTLEVSESVSKMNETLLNTNINTKNAVKVLQDYDKVIAGSQEKIAKVLEDNSKTQIIYAEAIEECKEAANKADEVHEELENTKEAVQENKQKVTKVAKVVKEHESFISRLKGMFK